MKTHPRQKDAVGSWKMHTTAFEVQQLQMGRSPPTRPMHVRLLSPERLARLRP